MPWSVVVRETKEVLDVYCTKAGAFGYRVYLRNAQHQVFLGYARHAVGDRSWDVFVMPHPYIPHLNSMQNRGFATRSYAIEHLLRMNGYWPEGDHGLEDHYLPRKPLEERSR